MELRIRFFGFEKPAMKECFDGGAGFREEWAEFSAPIRNDLFCPTVRSPKRRLLVAAVGPDCSNTYISKFSTRVAKSSIAPNAV